ncbi:uncharacterized conserved coiled coil protein [Roseobacter sp. AzwK-3b]|uniref:hypothetical protein n=1 Tax=Roseobacter sp. AzwK-3b TaxID=351016 RepID=UPI000156958E|nr:hypothetical protein [Roseobacter sp. AzwK-3b]EDM73001.1 uncharacterized conserved coiled coil protein [Roseobacter sp. AzwK-3b]
MDEKQAYQQKLDAKLDEWKAEIYKLRAKAEGASADAKLQYHDQIDDLKKRRDEMEKELEKIQNANAAAWNDLKAGADKAWEAMSDAMKDAWRRFG